MLWKTIDEPELQVLKSSPPEDPSFTVRIADAKAGLREAFSGAYVEVRFMVNDPSNPESIKLAETAATDFVALVHKGHF